MSIVINARFLTQSLTGVQRFALEISRELKKIDPAITCLMPKHDKNGMKGAKSLEPVRQGTLNGHLWEQIELVRYLKKNGSPLLLNLTNTAPLFYNNQVVTIHDLSFLRNPAWFSRSFYHLYRFLIPRIAKRALKIITVSEFSKSEIVELLKVPEEKVRVIHNAPFSEDISEEKHSDTEISDDGDYILTVSSINPRKNLHGLVDAFNALDANGLKLFIVGEWHRAYNNTDIMHKISKNDNIVLKGSQSNDELKRLYRNARMFVYPSFYEGFGLPPIEAMSFGCPVVTSNVTSLPEVCGDAVLYVDPHSVKSISAGMERVLDDNALRESMIKKGHEQAKKYSWKKSAGHYMDVIREII
jgi:glycosyltransferase involved in cell wall biosynthesis